MANDRPDLLRGLRDADADGVMALGVPLTVPSGRPLFAVGGEADRLFLVVRGRIALTVPIQVRGREENVVAEERSPGETLGWSSLVPPYRYTLQAIAQVDTELLTFPRAVLLDYFTTHPAVGYTVSLNVAAVIGHRLKLFQTMWLREMQRVVQLRDM